MWGYLYGLDRLITLMTNNILFIISWVYTHKWERKQHESFYIHPFLHLKWPSQCPPLHLGYLCTKPFFNSVYTEVTKGKIYTMSEQGNERKPHKQRISEETDSQPSEKAYVTGGRYVCSLSCIFLLSFLCVTERQAFNLLAKWPHLLYIIIPVYISDKDSVKVGHLFSSIYKLQVPVFQGQYAQ